MTGKKLTMKNGTEVILEPKFLSEEFCDNAEAYYREINNLKSNFHFNTYFRARAIEAFIIDNNHLPQYE